MNTLNPRAALLALAERWDDSAAWEYAEGGNEQYGSGLEQAASDLRAEVVRLWPEGADR